VDATTLIDFATPACVSITVSAPRGLRDRAVGRTTHLVVCSAMLPFLIPLRLWLANLSIKPVAPRCPRRRSGDADITLEVL
jgi:hypothetical protein